MKKLLSLVLMLALILSSTAALADFKTATVVDTAPRAINVQPAGANETEPGVSPTTGRDLMELYEAIEGETGYLGMSLTGCATDVLVSGKRTLIDGVVA